MTRRDASPDVSRLRVQEANGNRQFSFRTASDAPPPGTLT